MSMNRCENQSCPLIFKGLQERTRHHKKCGALSTIKPYLLAIRFHGVRLLTRKENSSQGSGWRLQVQFCYCKSGPKGPEYRHAGSGILTQFLFDKWTIYLEVYLDNHITLQQEIAQRKFSKKIYSIINFYNWRGYVNK